MEYYIIFLVISFWAVYSALVARMNITEIPFYQIFRHPEYFGGFPAMRRYSWWLFVWIVIANATALCIIQILKLASIPVGKAYDLIGYESPSGGEAGLITMLIFTVALYNYMVRKSHRIVFELTSEVHNNVLSGKTGFDEPSKPILNFKKPKELLNILFYLLPNLYAQVYLFFYRECHNIIANGCLQYVCEHYGHERILSFHAQCLCSQTNHAQFLDIQQTLDSLPRDDKAYVHVIVTALIRIRGFHNAIVEIENYLTSTSLEFTSNDIRETSRYRFVKPIKVKYINGKTHGKGVLYDWSENGCFMAVNKRVCVNEPVELKIAKKTFRGQHIHRNAQVFNGKVIRGIGLEMLDKKDWMTQASSYAS